MGTPSFNIGGYDFGKLLKAAAYIAISAFLVAIAQGLGGLDFSNTQLAGVNGQVMAAGVVNLLLYLAKLFVTDTRE